MTDFENDVPMEEFPDAYISIELYALPTGISLVENEAIKGIAVAVDGRRVGTASAGDQPGFYRFSPNASGRCYGGQVSTLQLIVLAQRFAKTQRGQLLTEPDRFRKFLEVAEASFRALPLRQIDRPREK